MDARAGLLYPHSAHAAHMFSSCPIGVDAHEELVRLVLVDAAPVAHAPRAPQILRHA